MNAILPKMWVDNGGPATIDTVPDPPGLQVLQTWEGHLAIAENLKQRRELQEAANASKGLGQMAAGGADSASGLWPPEQPRREEIAPDGSPSRVGPAEAAPTNPAAVIPAKATITGFAISPDGRLLAYCGGHGEIQLWNIEKHQVRSSIVPEDWQDGSSLSLASPLFTPDGQGLVVFARAS